MFKLYFYSGHIITYVHEAQLGCRSVGVSSLFQMARGGGAGVVLHQYWNFSVIWKAVR